jgi:hypothetical protein
MFADELFALKGTTSDLNGLPNSCPSPPSAEGRLCSFAVTRQTVTVKFSSFERNDSFGANNRSLIGQKRSASVSSEAP